MTQLRLHSRVSSAEAATTLLSVKLHLLSTEELSRGLQRPVSGSKPEPAMGQRAFVPLPLPSQVMKAWQLSGATTRDLAGWPAHTQLQPGQSSGGEKGVVLKAASARGMKAGSNSGQSGSASEGATTKQRSFRTRRQQREDWRCETVQQQNMPDTRVSKLLIDCVETVKQPSPETTRSDHSAILTCRRRRWGSWVSCSCIEAF